MRLRLTIDGYGEIVLTEIRPETWEKMDGPLAARIQHLEESAYVVEAWHEGQRLFVKGLMDYEKVESGDSVRHDANGLSITISKTDGGDDELSSDGQIARANVCLSCPDYRHPKKYRHPGCGIMRCCADGRPNQRRWFMNLRHPRGTCPLKKWPV